MFTAPSRQLGVKLGAFLSNRFKFFIPLYRPIFYLGGFQRILLSGLLCTKDSAIGGFDFGSSL